MHYYSIYNSIAPSADTFLLGYLHGKIERVRYGNVLTPFLQRKEGKLQYIHSAQGEYK